uniref:NADH-ubiquinone oxidoreductase chain 4L n=1 Tax=Ophiarachnella gorgonia TaxID=1365872 RepID=A0A6C0FD67_9ECHI|nr:NADH dehydrogenase subunit 4L [Ophiarachnella gorgonia]QHT54248.1 NADH dehydrogenase subunit 4L [Ophiarachnella gorgonia]
MNILYFIITFAILNAFISIVYNKKFILSIIICLESILLNLLFFNYLFSLINNTNILNSFSLFILTLSAIEASIGISLLTLVSRDFNNNNINNTNILKN